MRLHALLKNYDMAKENCSKAQTGGEVSTAGEIFNDCEIELHPWDPFIPENASVLIMGTFPPKPHRWSMDFYYPNRTNDFWKIMGIVYFNDSMALYDMQSGSFKLPMIKELLCRERIAMHDTGHKVRRLRGNASDKFLEIVEPVDLDRLLGLMPCCNTVVTTGEKAATVIAGITDTVVPKTGEYVDVFYTPAGRQLRIWRMPSSSRAYPLAVEKKASFYKRMFDDVRGGCKGL